MATHSHTTRAHSFNTAAAQYAANRPSYPSTLFDAIENLARRPLTGARVVDVGAGTGIATALLKARGANVLAIEPGDGMTAEFRRTLPDTPVVRGNGNALPLATASADFLTYAQSWHWTDPAHSIPEAFRVLRPDTGALALWWNTEALDIPWIAAAADRVERFLGLDAVVAKNGSGASAAATLSTTPAGPLHVDRDQVRWSRRVPVDTHLANLGSHSAFLVLGEEGANAFLTEESAHLLGAFPDGVIEEVYDVELIVATRS
ncbi:class I SAM-dependent methyltransferase [Streptomyces sp. NBC_00243]|uniref:class I SAM-dependent methyltransferase n=1 Tax=Streptomyces sp. NBC_00243 TaxID=2975688 RepID=UPI002DD94C34|nr:class I SAM-dependent methyltransferase [Streptomyces sp. NBC_00243]WRZ20737.1 class I SAM-dependent methyltransferase [Streptomyces sp. NBC_00243]